MVQNPRGGVRALPRVEQVPVLLCKPDAQMNQIPDDFRRFYNHLLHGGPVVLIVPGFQCVLKKAVVILLAFEHADSSLREEGVALIQSAFCEQKDLLFLRQVQRTIEPGGAGSDNDDICFLIQLNSQLSLKSSSFPAAFRQRKKFPHPG